MAERGPLVLVTRPAFNAELTEKRLTARGYRVLRDPVLDIVFNGNFSAVDTRQIQAILVTSANGVRALSAAIGATEGEKQEEFLALPVLAVGHASGEAARSAGFVNVTHAGGDAANLAALVEARLSPRDGALFHIAGRNIAGDLSGRLTQAGFDIRREVLYSAAPSTKLAPKIIAALKQGEIDGALFYSPRSARIFGELATASGVGPTLAQVSGVCLSRAVAEIVSPLGFAAIHIADKPDEPSLLAALDLALGP